MFASIRTGASGSPPVSVIAPRLFGRTRPGRIVQPDRAELSRKCYSLLSRRLTAFAFAHRASISSFRYSCPRDGNAAYGGSCVRPVGSAHARRRALTEPIIKTPVSTILTGVTLNGQVVPSVAHAGVLVERRRVPALKRGNAKLDFHYLLSWEHAPVVTEQSYNGRQSTRMTKVPGTVSLGLAGDLVPVRFHAPYQVVACLLDPVQVQTIMDEQDRPSLEPLHPHLLSEDEALATLVRLLMAEADIDGGSGRLYGESLALAIMSRFVTNAQMLPLGHAKRETHALSATRLRRVVEMMTSNLSDDLSLDILAQESGYSRAHFLRMFRAATGSTPHRYLRDRRLEYARDQLISGRRSITEIAHAAGFSSHSHLTKLFHDRFGAVPSDFRRHNSVS